MIKINNDLIDLILQVEDSVSIDKLLNRFTLETTNILLITTDVFASRLILHLYEESCVADVALHDMEDFLSSKISKLQLRVLYKGKMFNLYFIIWREDHKTVGTPFRGAQTFKLGFREIKL